MKRIMKWVLAATLISGASVFTSCVDNSIDNPVVQVYSHRVLTIQ